MNTPIDDQPTGFRGPVRGWADLAPESRRSLLLPRDRTALPGFARACEARAARVSEAQSEAGYDLIEVRAVTESLGRVEDVMAELARVMAPGGTVLLDVDNVQSPRMLRMVVEGRPGSFDPAGSTDDPSLPLPLRRVLAAIAAAGLSIVDVVSVQTGADEFAPALARDLQASGLLPLDWLQGAPPARFWITAVKRPSLAGSVLIAGADAAARERTAAAARSFLPTDWEIVAGVGDRECTQWNRAVAAANGDVVWFLRAGSTPSRRTFELLSAVAAVGAAAPGKAGVRWRQGDVAGLMMPRTDVLLAGPLPEQWANTQIALEDWVMRLDSKLPPALVVECAFDAPPPPLDAPDAFAAEAEQMLRRWSPIGAEAAPVPAIAKPKPEAPWAGREPRITLCMIARDEQRFLADCLSRAAPFVDEIVLVDTGSRDDTVGIAQSFGARVLHEEWQDDFSAPRNTALRAATGDWILVLDADEFLQPGAGERIRELVRCPAVSGYHLRFVNVYGAGRTQGVMMVRLFRNLPGLAYENVIHEQVTPSLHRAGTAMGLDISTTDVEVEHHGYTDEVMSRRGKNERNERLFVKQLSLQPNDVYGHYKYGDFLRRLPGRCADARALLERCLELILEGSPTLPRGLPYAGEVAALCALEAARAGEHARAREVLDIALRRFVPTPNLHYLAANLALAERRPADAILHFRRCLAYRGQTLVVPIQEGITSYVSLAGIAQAWMQRGDRDRAQRLLEQSAAMEPSYEVAHLALSRLWLERGDVARSLRVLTGFLANHPDSPGACQQLTLILQRVGRKNEAKRVGEHAVRLLEARALEHEATAMKEILAAI
jgi:tetratricopeptide (TPR) repeat protein